MPLADWASIGVRPKRKVCFGSERTHWMEGRGSVLYKGGAPPWEGVRCAYITF